MAGTVKPIPDGYHPVTPYLIAHDAAGAIDFFKKAFGAEEILRMAGPGGKIGHAEVRMGDSIVMLADEHPEVGAVSPRSLGGTSVHLLLYVQDVDSVMARALAAGAKLVKPLEDQFYGDRTGTVRDPSGHSWTIATHKEDVPPDEMARRAAASKGEG